MRIDNREPDTKKHLRQDAFFVALATKTPAQIDNWIDTNVTDLVSARNVLKMLVKTVKYLIFTGVIKV